MNPVNLLTEFMRLSRLGKIAVILSCLTVSLIGIDLLLSGGLLMLLGSTEEELLEYWVFAAQWNAFFITMLLLPTALLFILWIRGRVKELGRLKVKNLEYSTKKAVCMFFIPYVNLIEPLHIAQAIWRASNPATSHYDPHAPGNSRLIRLWWGLFLLYGLSANTVFDISHWAVRRVMDIPEGASIQGVAEPLSRGLGLTVGIDILGLIAGVLFIQVMLQIEARQRAKRDSLDVGAAPALA